jgi:hypothetical protein
MTSSRRVLERIADRAPVPEPAYERFLQRRDADRGKDRVTGLVVGLLVLALVAAAVTVGSRDRRTPVGNPTPAPSPSLPGPLSRELLSGVDQQLQSGRYWLSRGDLFVSFDVPSGWSTLGDLAVLGDRRTFVSFWLVDHVAIDPCHWAGKWRDPGTSVDQLVDALSTQPGAADARDVTIAGYEGRSMRLRVPRNVPFKDCDVAPDRGGGVEPAYIRWSMSDTDFRHWPDQIDQVWIVDVHGERLVIAAGLFPDTSARTRAEIDSIVDSISIS